MSKHLTIGHKINPRFIPDVCGSSSLLGNYPKLKEEEELNNKALAAVLALGCAMAESVPHYDGGSPKAKGSGRTKCYWRDNPQNPAFKGETNKCLACNSENKDCEYCKGLGTMSAQQKKRFKREQDD